MRYGKGRVWGRAIISAASAAWVGVVHAAPIPYNIRQIGLTGSDYTYSVNTNAVVQAVNGSGEVLGTSTRYNSSGANPGQDGWVFNGNATVQVGLLGGAYETPYYLGGTLRSTDVLQLNANGQAIGTSDHYSGGGVQGKDAWVFDGTQTQAVGLTGGVYRTSTPLQLNDAGTVLGYTSRINGSGGDLGQDAFVGKPGAIVQVGLTGTTYSATYTGSGGGTTQFTAPLQINAAGRVIGYTKRGTTQGQDAWYYDGATTQVIGLTGVDYQYTLALPAVGTYRSSTPVSLNDAGQAVGYTLRWHLQNQIGQDAWFFNGSSTQQIGLTGASYQSYNSLYNGYVQQSSTVRLTKSGHVFGYTERYDATTGSGVHRDMWYFDGTSSRRIDLTGGVYDRDLSIPASDGIALTNDANFAAGTSARTGSADLGHDAWLFDGNTTRRVGLIGAGYEYTNASTQGGVYRASVPAALGSGGDVAGISFTYKSTGTPVGQDAWLYHAGTTRQIGLTGAGYSVAPQSGGDPATRYASVTAVNGSGQVIGTSERLSATGTDLGPAGWFYDPVADASSPLVFSTRSDGYASTAPKLLTDGGVVLGQYELFNGASDLGTRIFWWSTAQGFSDLGALINGGLSANGWQQLAALASSTGADLGGLTTDGAPAMVVGTGVLNGQTGSSAFLVTATPEPTTAAGAALAALALSACRPSRRRRRTRGTVGSRSV